MKRISLAMIMGFMLFMTSPMLAQAHVKWFTDLVPEKEAITEIISPLFIGLTLLIAILLAVLTQVLPSLSSLEVSRKFDDKLDSLRTYSTPILKYGTAAALLIQAFSNTLFAPEFQTVSPLENILLWVAIILLLVPHHWATKVSALVILWLFIQLTMRAGLFHMLDYGFYVAIAGVLLLEKTPAEKWGYPLLYLGTGLSLCWVAVEKWVYPAMAVDIIEQHGVPTFGFAPEVFVVLAAFIEFIVGYLLVVGILNRLLALVLTGIFVSTTMLFGMKELIGHFMIHIVLLTFIIEGVSFYKPPVTMHKTILEQMVFVSLNFIFTLATFMLIYYRFA